MLWVTLGAGGAGYAFVCDMQGCTTSQCTTDEFLFPLYNGEPWVITAVGGLAAGVWVLLAIPLLVAGFVRLRGWRPRKRLRAATWAGAWIAGLALMVVVVAVGGIGSDFPDVGWGELPVFAAWLALGAWINQILPGAAHRGDMPEASGRSISQGRARPGRIDRPGHAG
jgi:amino acid transporter